MSHARPGAAALPHRPASLPGRPQPPPVALPRKAPPPPPVVGRGSRAVNWPAVAPPVAPVAPPPPPAEHADLSRAPSIPPAPSRRAPLPGQGASFGPSGRLGAAVAASVRPLAGQGNGASDAVLPGGPRAGEASPVPSITPRGAISKRAPEPDGSQSARPQTPSLASKGLSPSPTVPTVAAHAGPGASIGYVSPTSGSSLRPDLPPHLGSPRVPSTAHAPSAAPAGEPGGPASTSTPTPSQRAVVPTPTPSQRAVVPTPTPSQRAVVPTSADENPPASRTLSRRANASPSGGGEKKVILVVEDDACTRELLVRALSREFVVHSAENAERGLAAVGQLPALDEIVTDVMMPGMDGFQFARALKGLPACRNVPLMFLTAKDSATDIVLGINAGARHYLTKPFKLDQLLDKVRKMTQG